MENTETHSENQIQKHFVAAPNENGFVLLNVCMRTTDAAALDATLFVHAYQNAPMYPVQCLPNVPQTIMLNIN